ncbi:hypothetical protein B0H14DRAFT_2615687 [Mycena olivaceomarginata]|nr:hypothetical protein B0H14DRAFT_2615687 [Mycena olivaceomarginata]
MASRPARNRQASSRVADGANSEAPSAVHQSVSADGDNTFNVVVQDLDPGCQCANRIDFTPGAFFQLDSNCVTDGVIIRRCLNQPPSTLDRFIITVAWMGRNPISKID